ncbi:MAG TPA: hypothetical protein VHC96_11035 [Puia sp.]|jgi:hypothetical protein|nr:hypothetical protein [Puia sp.]
MKFHRSLLVLSGISVGLCILFFYFSYNLSTDENGKGFTLVLGWILWLGVMALLGPLMISPETRVQWFSKEYGVGTIVLLLVTVLAVIAGNALAYSLTR